MWEQSHNNVSFIIIILDGVLLLISLWQCLSLIFVIILSIHTKIPYYWISTAQILSSFLFVCWNFRSDKYISSVEMTRQVITDGKFNSMAFLVDQAKAHWTTWWNRYSLETKFYSAKLIIINVQYYLVWMKKTNVWLGNFCRFNNCFYSVSDYFLSIHFCSLFKEVLLWFYSNITYK